MLKRFLVYLQNILPQHLLSRFCGMLANCKTVWFKNLFIERFIKTYKVDLSEAIITDPKAYPDFNTFFIRQLKPELRPINPELNIIVSPNDASVAQVGRIQKNQLLQAKNFYFDLKNLLTDETLASTFYNGSFATFYLAPHNYHRVHVPLDGKLTETIYVPGKLFSVNKMTCDLIPNIFSRNERIIFLFETVAGKVAVIMVGALIVGSIQMSWMNQPTRANKIIRENFAKPFKKGDELGYFKLGSTVIVLFQENHIEWEKFLTTDANIKVGQGIAKIP